MATPAVTRASPERSPFPVIVIGTRAQLVKMAPVMRELEARRIEFRLLFTGQHLVTMHELLDDFEIKTKPVWLGQRQEIDSVAKMFLWLPAALWRLAVTRRELLRDPASDRSLVIVHGDTVSTLVGAIAGRLNRCRVAHVESGLRSFSIRDPFPEELTRRLIFRLIHVAFCPGPWAAKNMDDYRVTVVNTGANTLLDAVRHAIGTNPTRARKTGKRKYCVVSIHRHENLASSTRLQWILDMVHDIAHSHDVHFVLHPSTRVRLERSGHLDALTNQPRIQLRNRMGYLAFMEQLAKARFVLTDGGSNQEELFYLGIPTLIARERSERPEGIGLNAELISPESTSGWQDRLAIVQDRLVSCSASGDNLEPSRVVVDWLEITSSERGYD